jgi:cytidyltransferase-like protein
MESENKRVVVLATGVFDVLHIEHIRFLAAAKQQGDYLKVGVECDVRVRQIKGAGRPINPEAVRLEQVRSVKFVDEAFLLPERFDRYEDWLELMKQIQPDVYAVSGHTSHLDTKKAICERVGTRLVVVRPHDPSISTTLLLEKLKK